MISVYLLHASNHDPADYSASAAPRLHLDAATIAGRWTVIGALWWTASLIITTATSKVIYGLQQEMRDARRLGQYTLLEKDARRWFDLHGPSLRARQARSSVGAAKTVAVDLGLRLSDLPGGLKTS